MPNNARSPFERIVGGSDNEKRKAVEQLREWRSEQVMLQRPFEVAKTEKDKRIIELIEELVDKTIRTYGGNPAPFQGERIFMVRPASIKKLTDSKFERGFYSPLAHYVMVERPSSDVQFALDLAHELLHVKSFQSGRVSKKGQADVRVYRSGISMVDRKDLTREMGEEFVYWKALEEAIVSEVSQRLYERDIRTNALFQKEVEAVEKIKKRLSDALERWRRSNPERALSKEEEDEILTEMRSLPEQVLNGLAEYETENYREDRKLQLLLASLLRALASREVGFRERLRERQKLDELLYRLLQQMPEKFQSKEELFSEFAKANFTGNYLPLARLIEKSMGKGSFRRLAKEFGSADSGK